jgi:WD40 repeat protein
MSGAVRPFPGVEKGEDVVGLAASPDGSRVATCRRSFRPGVGMQWVLACWAVGGGALSLLWSEKSATPHPESFLGPTFDFASSRLATVDGGYRSSEGRYAVRCRDASTAANLSEPLCPDNYISSIDTTFTPDGRQLLVWDQHKVVAVDLAKGTARTINPSRRALLRWVAVHPSGRFFVTVGNDGVARYWDAESLTLTQGFKWKAGKLSCVAFSPDGTLAAAGTESGKVVLWDVDD